jgi:hypothetical protein
VVYACPIHGTGLKTFRVGGVGSTPGGIGKLIGHVREKRWVEYELLDDVAVVRVASVGQVGQHAAVRIWSKARFITRGTLTGFP